MEDKQNDPNGLSGRINKLPDEILNAQSAGVDYLKWKLILVAGLGAAALGSGGNKPFYLLLALIPLVCIYVDLLCAGLSVRMIAIGRFYANVHGDSYECFARHNKMVFRSEDWAQRWSTYAICLAVGGIGLLRQTFYKFEPSEQTWLLFWQWYAQPSKEDGILIASALFGFVLAMFTNRKCRGLIKTLSPPFHLPEYQNRKLGGLFRAAYTPDEFQALRVFLDQKGVFLFKGLPNGLFSAASSAGENDKSGYQYVWVRDNVHVAHAHWICGDRITAGRNLSALMRFFHTQQKRFRAIVEDAEVDPEKALAADPMNRPHIRFDGRELSAVRQKWPHAQNDALGYFLWFYCKLVKDAVVHPSDADLECLADFPRYFKKIRYWQDRDSGHWEEVRKVSASSIGTVIAGLREFEHLLENNPKLKRLADHRGLDLPQLQDLRHEGEKALKRILPNESVGSVASTSSNQDCHRRYDSALLFLIYPLEVLDGEDAAGVLADVRTHLQGDYGIRRYLGDSYWFPDYKKIPWYKRISGWKLTGDFSGSMEARDRHVRPGEEAQWCLFDPILSVIYGRWHLRCQNEGKTREAKAFLELQTAHLNRSLAQLYAGSADASMLLAPEAYYLENGRYVPNDHCPLLWTQANLWLAVNQMQQSLDGVAGTVEPPNPLGTHWTIHGKRYRTKWAKRRQAAVARMKKFVEELV
ncbi:Glycoside hydrolase 15-related protein (modular protein) [Desulfosarcina cetonica]|nr:Glycoside hydrolase 15-related protein (modular protein) [Desulfosarcina cetonica]